ncbi:MAG: phosphate signaling complex PhoU family protein [Pseudonocardiaceae bacterium]
MRAAFHAELDELIGDLARMGRLATQIMINASAALLQADRALADLVIARADEMDRQHHDVEQRCTTLLALQAPVAMDRRTVVASLHALGDLQRMVKLAQHTAQMARRAHPHLAVPDEVRPMIARLSLLACGLAQHAATAIETLDPLPGDRLAQADDVLDALLRELLRTLFAENWSHGVVPAIHVALVGRYYERFADHAVAVARQAGTLATERMQSRSPVTPRKTASVV